MTLKVLILHEPHHELRRGLARALEDRGYEVFEAESSEKAMQLENELKEIGLVPHRLVVSNADFFPSLPRFDS